MLIRALAESAGETGIDAMFFRRLEIWKILILVGLVALAPFAVLAHPRARAALRFTAGFRSLESDPRVFYEDGAEALALRFADSLPGAIASVEKSHVLPFKNRFRVYVCSTHQNFTRHLGEAADSPARGMALFRDVWVSPSAFSFEGFDTHRQTLIHELSHLHLSQHLGVWGSVRTVPAWFREGLADWAADTGAEIVSRQQAMEAFASGRHLTPDATGRFLFPRSGPDYGLSWPMFHRQSRLFVEYLQQRDGQSFRRFLVTLLTGTPFNASLSANFGDDLGTLWGEFLNSMQGHG